MTDDRDPVCVERWPECDEGLYDPRCCRFPKSCSCTIRVDREPQPSDGPDYHADHASWEQRQREQAGPARVADVPVAASEPNHPKAGR